MSKIVKVIESKITRKNYLLIFSIIVFSYLLIDFITDSITMLNIAESIRNEFTDAIPESFQSIIILGGTAQLIGLYLPEILMTIGFSLLLLSAIVFIVFKLEASIFFQLNSIYFSIVTMIYSFYVYQYPLLLILKIIILLFIIFAFLIVIRIEKNLITAK